MNEKSLSRTVGKLSNGMSSLPLTSRRFLMPLRSNRNDWFLTKGLFSRKQASILKKLKPSSRPQGRDLLFPNALKYAEGILNDEC